MKHKNKKIIIHPTAVLFFVLIFAFSPPFFTLTVLVCAAFHELGHYFCAKLLKYSIESVKIYPLGMDMKLCDTCSSYLKDALVAFSGPFANIVFALILRFFRNTELLVFYNICLCVMNLFPLKGLDGGTILYSILCMVFSHGTAYKIHKAISFFILFAVYIISVYVMLCFDGDPSLFLICIMLFLGVSDKDALSKQ